MGIADMGCSSGPNTLSNVKDFVGAVQEACRKTQEPVPEFRFYLNDLPTNDFNTIFQALPDLYKELTPSSSVYVGGFPATFYGRVFPERCLHLVYSSYSLHWLSRVSYYYYTSKILYIIFLLHVFLSLYIYIYLYIIKFLCCNNIYNLQGSTGNI